jgi:hypothetical protein
VTDEEAQTARFLIATGQIEQAANECLDRKIAEGFTCLGNPEDLTIKIFLSYNEKASGPYTTSRKWREGNMLVARRLVRKMIRLHAS